MMWVGLNSFFPTHGWIGENKLKKDLTLSAIIRIFMYQLQEKQDMKKKLKTKEFKGYTPEQLAYFQAQEDMNDGIEDVQDVDYVDYLMGNINNPYDGMTETREFEDLDGESDWFMD